MRVFHLGTTHRKCVPAIQNFKFKTREEVPSLMNTFQRRTANVKLLVDPIEQRFSCFEKRRKWTKESVRQRANYYKKSRTIFQPLDNQTVYFCQCIFSRSTENDPFVQIITIMTRTGKQQTYMLNGSIRYAISFPTVIKTDSASTGYFKRTMVLCMPCALQ